MAIDSYCLITAAAGAGWLLSILLEYALLPAVLRQRSSYWRNKAVHLGLWLLVYGLELLLWQRPWFAALNVLALHALILLVNNAKYQALREPFIFQDFEYFTDAIRHPRLYLPFFGVWPAIAAAAGFVLVVIAGLMLEPTLPASWLATAVCGLVLAVAGWLLARAAARSADAMSFAAVRDTQEYGFLSSLWAYAVAERRSVAALREAAPFAVAGGQRDARALPDLVTIQSESFFDARRAFPAVNPDVLTQFDRLRAESVACGQLTVDAWGANTVRTEFSFLAGLDAEQLGVHRFNPYRVLAQQGVATLASFLRKQGYRTVCVHPYVAGFYRRDHVMPLLGFDTFLTLPDFADAEHFGPYVSDKAVADKVCALLGEERTAPLFIHVITMENHGPLHWESVTPEERQDLLGADATAETDELAVYTRHLRNVDHLYAQVAATLQTGTRPGGLCLFGDHVPIMPKVYQTWGEPDGKTDYLIWSSTHAGRNAVSTERVLTPAQLSFEFVRHMDLLEV